MSMLDDNGYFNRPWLDSQPTERLRYEARCERVRDWQAMPRHRLLLLLSQLPIVPNVTAVPDKKVKTNGPYSSS